MSLFERRCKNCRHWIVHISWDDDWGNCTLLSVPASGDRRDDALAYPGLDGYQTDFETNKDFGCVQFEPKEFL